MSVVVVMRLLLVYRVLCFDCFAAGCLLCLGVIGCWFGGVFAC